MGTAWIQAGALGTVIQALCGAQERSLHVTSTQKVSWLLLGVDSSVSISVTAPFGPAP